MNYRYPLLNLVARDHLKVSNKIGTQKFIENLDNESCKAILENLLFKPDSSECTRLLEDIKEAYELQNNIRVRVSDRTLNESRDNILLRENDDYPNVLDVSEETKKNVNSIISYVKYGLPAAAVLYILKIPKKERDAAFTELKMYHSKTYDFLKSSPLLKKVLPEEVGFIPRTAHAAWTFDKSKLKTSDVNYLKKLGKIGKTAALVAAGITTAIIGISVAYKELFSAEARKCNKYSGKTRTICMSDAIIAASELALKKSEDALLKCDSAKDPQDCRYKMRVEIRHWQNKIYEQKRKLARLQVNPQPYPTKEKQQSVPVQVAPPSDPFMEEKPKVSKPKPVVVKKEPPKKTEDDIVNKTLTDPFGEPVTDLDDFKQTSNNPFG